jgi:biotin carboxyl carrier protein
VADDVERLVDIVARANVAEVTVRSGNRRVTVRRVIRAARAVGASTGPKPGRVEPREEPSGSPGPLWITAPMVGLYHPSDPPATVGMAVRAGQVVGVIESMKLMNDVRAEANGTVTEIAVDEGMPVEYGQPLIALALEPD